MTDTNALIDRHRGFAQQFDAGGLAMPPRLSTVILTCVDARVDPAHLFSLALGDVLVIRNTGGRVTRDVVRDLGVLGVLSENWPGDKELELIVVHHTNCGMARLEDPEIRTKVAERLGLDGDQVKAMAITDPAASVGASIGALRDSRAAPDQMLVSGYVYDVADGSLTEVVPPAPLRGAS